MRIELSDPFFPQKTFALPSDTVFPIQYSSFPLSKGMKNE
jgi:hypothetical protein